MGLGLEPYFDEVERVCAGGCEAGGGAAEPVDQIRSHQYRFVTYSPEGIVYWAWRWRRGATGAAAAEGGVFVELDGVFGHGGWLLRDLEDKEE